MIETHACVRCDLCNESACLPPGLPAAAAVDWALRSGWSYSDGIGHACPACTGGAPAALVGFADGDELAQVLIPGG